MGVDMNLAQSDGSIAGGESWAGRNYGHLAKAIERAVGGSKAVPRGVMSTPITIYSP